MQQIQLFNGVSIAEAFRGAVTVTHNKAEAKPAMKDGKQLFRKDGKTPRMVGPKDSTIVSLLPRTAKEGENSLALAFPDYKGQNLMAFEVSARKELADAMLKHLAGKVMTGEIVFNRASINNRTGGISCSFKRAGVKVIGEITPEAATAKLGITPEQLAAIKETAVQA